jgi:hypothetical protein
MSEESIGFGIGRSKQKFYIVDIENNKQIWFYQDPFRLPELTEFERLTNSDLESKKVQKDSIAFFVDALNLRRVDRTAKISVKVFNLLSSQELLGIGVLLAAGGLGIAEETKDDGTTEKK